MSRQNGLYRKHGRRIFCFKYKDKSGAWQEKSTGEADRAEAIKAKDAFLKDLADDQLPTQKAKWTVEQACSLWVSQHVLGSRKARSNEQSALRQLVRLMGSKKLDQITIDDLRNYQAERSKTVKERPVNIELQILKRVLVQENLWKGSLARNYKRLKEPDPEVGIRLSIDEVARLEAAAASRDSFLVAYCAEVLAACTGMRGCEIRKLKLGSIDLVNKRLHITRKATKSKKGQRLIELNRDALLAVAKLDHRAQLLGACSPDHYLLPANLSRHTREDDPLRGTGFDPTHHQVSWNTAWRSLRKLAGLGNVRFHDLRHTFISMQGENGTPLQVVRAMVGHMSTEMTDYYTQISSSAARQAVEKLENLRKPPCFGDTFGDAVVPLNAKFLN